ncbi:hypothetical protein [Amycolatopsis sp. cmx-4-68]|uniref:hypothetical protein n=1 Tax=Amycolatopsis sp. cmx-4-68 TaxID=2790938 RepID=UPI00397A35CE
MAAPHKITNDEWLLIDPRRSSPPPVHQDYALVKVLYNLRKGNRAAGIRIHPFQADDKVRPTPLDFKGLHDTDVIFIVGHGGPDGLHVMGPNKDTAMKRLVNILTGDGNLKKLRTGKSITIALLSCRSGFGFHKALARRLSRALSIDVTVIGALGFTFGSKNATLLALNEVLVRGIPWDMEYFLSIRRDEAEKVTSAREGKTLTVAGKQTEINRFKAIKGDLETDLSNLVKRLQSKEVNLALDEIESHFQRLWLELLRKQFEHYSHAKKASNLEFDMWHDPVPDGYVWTDGRMVTDDQADAILTGDQVPVGDGLTTVR